MAGEEVSRPAHARYSFDGKGEGELPMTAGQEVEVLDDGDAAYVFPLSLLYFFPDRSYSMQVVVCPRRAHRKGGRSARCVCLLELVAPSTCWTVFGDSLCFRRLIIPSMYKLDLQIVLFSDRPYAPPPLTLVVYHAHYPPRNSCMQPSVCRSPTSITILWPAHHLCNFKSWRVHVQ